MSSYDKYIPLKTVFESLFGASAWKELKLSNDLGVWKKWTKRLFAGIEKSIDVSVEHSDSVWRSTVKDVLRDGNDGVNSIREIDDLIALIASVFIQLSFWQVGFMPERSDLRKGDRIMRSDWDLRVHRSVVYLQTKKQKADLAFGGLQKKIPLGKAMALEREYNASGSGLDAAEWLSTIKDIDPHKQ